MPTAASGIPTTNVTGFTVGYNNPTRMLRAPLFIGQSQELGFFEEVGITDFEVNDADDPVPPMVAGEYQIALFDSDVLFDALDKDIERASKTIYAAFGKIAIQFPGSKIHSDIGKTVAVLQILGKFACS